MLRTAARVLHRPFLPSPCLLEYLDRDPLARASHALGLQHCNAQRVRRHGGSTVDPAEAAKFAADAALWWEEDKGPFAPLHTMNPARCQFIRAALCRRFDRDPWQREPLAGLRLLDVGCGGGILVEPLARMGASVTGIDAVEQSIHVARLHAALDPAVASRADYRAVAAEQLVAEGASFDAVLSLEVVEHVADPELFVRSLSALTRPGGAVVVSTINRTLRSFALGIVAAERILGWVPPGTHEWRRFLKPEELAVMLEQEGLELEEMAGMRYLPVTGKWQLSSDTGVGYIALATKPLDGETTI